MDKSDTIIVSMDDCCKVEGYTEKPNILHHDVNLNIKSDPDFPEIQTSTSLDDSLNYDSPDIVQIGDFKDGSSMDNSLSSAKVEVSNEVGCGDVCKENNLTSNEEFDMVIKEDTKEMKNNSECSTFELNSVDFLLNNESLTYEQRSAIKRLGRPIPDLKFSIIYVSSSHTHSRKFNTSIYDRFDWVCGCSKRNRLFCFICLLMGGGGTAWSQEGVNDLKNLYRQTTRHANSEKHLFHTLGFSVLGNTDIKQQLGGMYRVNVSRHNENVDKNRHILSQVINCIRFCGAFELALHSESENSDNPTAFGGLVDFISESDSIMKEHLLKATAFSGISKSMQNELLDAMLQVCRDEIVDQIKSSLFVSVQVDEITDVANTMQIVLILRYVHNSIISERFWGFVRPEEYTAEHLANAILEELHMAGVKPEQLIAQCFNGLSFTSGQLSSVRTKINEKYPLAHFVHCYAHRLELVVKEAASVNKKVKIFLSNLDGFDSFFSSSSEQAKLLEFIRKRTLKGPTFWNFKSTTISLVYENKNIVSEYLETIRNSANDTKTINEATELINYLSNREFLFWLDIFHCIMLHVDVLYRRIQKKTATGRYIETCLAAFKTEIAKVKLEIVDVPVSVKTASKRPRCAEDVGDNSGSAAKGVCDVILTELMDRFAFLEHLSLSNLLASDRFTSYRANFPVEDLNASVRCYNFFVPGKLRAELNALYNQDDMTSMEGIAALLYFLKENKLEETFSETYKLCNVVATIPMITSESERCYSTLKHVKTFLRNTVNKDRLAALAMLSIEKTMVKQITGFNEKVINIFAHVKNRQADLLYK